MKKILEKFFYALSNKVIGAIAALYLVALITNGLTIEDAGKYFYAISILLLLSNLAKIGAEQQIIKLSAGLSTETESGKLNYIFKSFLYRYIWVGIFVTILSIILLNLLPSTILGLKTDNHVSSSLLAITFIVCSWIIASFMIATNKVFVATFCTAILPPSITIFLVSFWGITLDKVVFFYIASWGVVFVVFLILNSKRLIGVSVKEKSDVGVNLYKFGFSNVVDLLIANLPVLYFASLYSNKEVALYSVCIRITAVISFVFTASGKILSAKIVSIGNERKKVALVLKIAILGYCLLFLVFGFFLYFFSEIILSYFGQDYLQARNMLLVLYTSQFLSGIYSFVRNSMQMCGHENKILLHDFYRAVVFFLSIILFDFYGDFDSVILAILFSALFSTSVIIKSMVKNVLK